MKDRTRDWLSLRPCWQLSVAKPSMTALYASKPCWFIQSGFGAIIRTGILLFRKCNLVCIISVEIGVEKDWQKAVDVSLKDFWGSSMVIYNLIPYYCVMVIFSPRETKVGCMCILCYTGIVNGRVDCIFVEKILNRELLSDVSISPFERYKSSVNFS